MNYESNKKLPRGVRNCNPLNIRKGKSKWKGLREQQQDKAFCQFTTMEMGWRAAFIVLYRTYYQVNHRSTIRKIITAWAPPTENNTEAYIERVCSISHLSADETLCLTMTDPCDLQKVAWAMAEVENGGTEHLDPIDMLEGFHLCVQDMYKRGGDII